MSWDYRMLTPEIIEDLAKNSSFSRTLPALQLSIDSTSLGEFKTCPRRYFYRIICGWQPATLSFHLTFGLLYHGALERYDHKRASGASHDDALDFAIDWTLRETWDKELKRGWISGDSNKTRLTLIRTIIDYCDRFGPADNMETLILANGKPAVELSFSFAPGFDPAPTGERYTLCGHLDRIVTMHGEQYVQDRKTTAHTLAPSYFAQFSPHNQFTSIY